MAMLNLKKCFPWPFFFFLALRDLHSLPLSPFTLPFFDPSSLLFSPFFPQSIINTTGKESHVLMLSSSHLIDSARVNVQRQPQSGVWSPSEGSEFRTPPPPDRCLTTF